MTPVLFAHKYLNLADKIISMDNRRMELPRVSKPKIYEFLNGKSPLQTTFVRLAEFLEIDPNELIVEV